MSAENFLVEFEVRDNELDAQGIVNNANYMIYLSHARHKHGELLNINHTEYAQKKLNLVLTSCTMKFRNSLHANDKFTVSSKLTKADLPFHWSHVQEIKRISDGKVVLKAVFNATCVDLNPDHGRDSNMFIPEQIEQLIA